MAQRVAGIIEIKADGGSLAATGTFSINLGLTKREGQLGANGRNQGYKETGQLPFIKGMVRDLSSVNFTTDIHGITDATITLQAANGKTYMWEKAYYCADGDGDTEEGTWQLEFEAEDASEI